MNWVRLIVLAVIVAAAVAACVSRDQHLRAEERAAVSAHYEQVIQKMRSDHDEAMRQEHERVRAAEMHLAKALQEQEKKDAFNKTQVDDLRRRLDASVARNAGRLRDPNGCGAPGGKSAGAAAPAAEHRDADRAETAGLLSAQLTGLLRRLQREADEINTAYASCREDLLRKSGGQ